MLEVWNPHPVALSRRTQYVLVSQVPALILLAYLSLMTLGLLDNVRGPFFPEILEDLKMNGTYGSAFFAVVSLLAFVGSLTSHHLVRRWSTLNTMLFASLFFAIGFALISRASSWLALAGACAVFGWAFGTLNVTQNVLVCEASSARARRQWLSGLHGIYGVSALLAPLIATFLRERAFTWRESFLLLAIAPAAVTFFGLWLRPPRGRVSAREEKLGAGDWSACIFFCALMALYLWGELSASSRLVLWLRTERDFSPKDADYLLAAFFLALLSGRFLFTFLHFRRLSNWVILCASAFFGAVFYVWSLHASPWITVLSALAMAPFYPVIMDQASKTFGDKAPQAISWIIGIGNLSLVIMHVTIGWVGDLFGVTVALHCGAGALLLVALALLRRLDSRV